MRIIFMGTPEFAVPSLRILVEAGYDIVGVVTVPDKPAGRGHKLRPSPVKMYAQEQGLEVLQPVKLRNPEFLARLRELTPDLMVVVAFRMLPELVWSIPTIGTFNLHASLLPDYRGAAPINWVVMNGETQTGATTFFIDHKIDTGQILLQSTLDIPYTWTAGDLHDQLMQEGAKLVLKTVQGLEQQILTPQPQNHELAIHKAPKIFKEDCVINWEQPAESVYHFIRGLSPYPAARTTLQDKMLKVFMSQVGENTDNPPGTVQLDMDALQIACQDKWLVLTEVQLEGKRRMPIDVFLQGYRGNAKS